MYPYPGRQVTSYNRKQVLLRMSRADDNTHSLFVVDRFGGRVINENSRSARIRTNRCRHTEWGRRQLGVDQIRKKGNWEKKRPKSFKSIWKIYTVGIESFSVWRKATAAPFVDGHLEDGPIHKRYLKALSRKQRSFFSDHVTRIIQNDSISHFHSS